MLLRRFRYWATGVILVLVIAMGVGACSNSNTTNSAGSATGSASSKSYKGTIVIGNIGTYTGPLASTLGGIPQVLNAWSTIVNNQGGLDGYKVNLVNDDVGSAPAGTDLRDAQQLINNDHAAAIIDYEGNNADAAWLKYADAANVPVLVGVPLGIADIANKDVFPISTTVLAYIASVESLAKTHGSKFGIADEQASSATAQLFKAFAPAFGLQIPVAVQLNPESPDFTAFCSLAKGVQSYFVAGPSSFTTNIGDQCHGQGLAAPQILGSHEVLPAWKADPAFNGSGIIDFLATPFWSTATPAGAAYRNMLAKYTQGIIGTELDQTYPESAWALGQLISTTTARVKGTLSGPTLKAALYTFKGETLGGLTQPLTFTPNQPTDLRCYFSWTISNKNYLVPPGGGTPHCISSSIIDPVQNALLKAAGLQ
jgi:branched-chain amino acid transport system substrate-binding protein